MSAVSSSSSLRLPVSALSRAYAAKAAQAVSAGSQPEIKVSTLDNGLRLASVDSPTPGLAHVGLFVRAGSRYETYETQGAAHALQIAAGLASKNHSFFGITRNMQQLGSAIQCAQGREYIAYGAAFEQNKMDEGVDYFLEATTNPAFKSWELSDSMHRMEAAVKSLNQCDRSVELLHAAAFRDGLGNSIIAPEHTVGKHKAPLLQGFFNRNVTSHRTTLVGVGVDHSQLVKYANLIKLESGQGEAAKSKYYGGEQRSERGGATATICLAGQTAGYNNVKESSSAWALQHILGNSKVKYVSAGGKVQKALADVADDVVFAKGAAFCYSDAALVGVQMNINAAAAGKAVSAVAAGLRSLAITDADLAAAKKSMIRECFDLGPAATARAVGEEVLFTGEAMQPDQLMALINGVSLGEVQAVAKKAFGGKLSMASVGNLSTVPYLDAL